MNNSELLKEKEEIKNEIIELLKQKEEIKYDNNIVDIKEQLNIIFLSSFTFFFVFFITYSN